jgi:hypothetical protein
VLTGIEPSGRAGTFQVSSSPSIVNGVARVAPSRFGSRLWLHKARQFARDAESLARPE